MQWRVAGAKLFIDGIYIPEETALIDTVRGRDDRSYRLVVEQTGVENEVKSPAAPVAGLQCNPIDGLLCRVHGNGAQSGL